MIDVFKIICRKMYHITFLRQEVFRVTVILNFNNFFIEYIITECVFFTDIQIMPETRHIEIRIRKKK